MNEGGLPLPLTPVGENCCRAGARSVVVPVTEEE
jgi:hypothetical protein